jgi:hypothetical protein
MCGFHVTFLHGPMGTSQIPAIGSTFQLQQVGEEAGDGHTLPRPHKGQILEVIHVSLTI